MSFLLNIKQQVESVRAQNTSFVGAVEFDQELSISESISLFNRELSIMNEEVNFLDIESDQVLLEAVLSQHPEADVLVENVGKKMVDKLKEWWKKLVAWVKGLIAKIKQRISLMTSNKNKFVDRVREALKNKTSDDTSKFRWKGYKWSVSELNKLSSDGEAAAKTGVGELKDMTNITEPNNVKGMTPDAVKKLQEEGKKSVEKVKKAYYGTETPEKSREKLVKACRGNNKLDELSFSKVAGRDEMIKFIEGSDDMSETLLTAYETVQTQVETIINKLDQSADTIDKWDTNTGDDATNQNRVDIVTAFKAAAKVQKDTYNSILSDIGKGFGTRRAIIDEAAKDFMRILRSFAAYKAPKK